MSHTLLKQNGKYAIVNNEYIVQTNTALSEISANFGDRAYIVADDKHKIYGESGWVDYTGGISGADNEKISNKVTSLSSASTDTQYPSAKITYNTIAPLVTNHNWLYDGRDLSSIFTVAQLVAAVRAADWTNIRIGDYWPITLTGTLVRWSIVAYFSYHFCFSYISQVIIIIAKFRFFEKSYLKKMQIRRQKMQCQKGKM